MRNLRNLHNALLGLCVLFSMAVSLGAQPALAEDNRPICGRRPDDHSIPWPPPWCRLAETPTTRSARSLLLRLAAPGAQVAGPGQVVRYDLVILNAGTQAARDVRLVVPFAANTQQLLDVALSSQEAWVSSASAGMLAVDVLAIGQGEAITATLRFTLAPELPADADLAPRAQIQSVRLANGPTVWSNRLFARAGQAIRSSFDLTDPQRSVDRAGDTLALGFDGFASNERVSAWLQRVGEPAAAIAPAYADALGAATYALSTAQLAPGSYQLVLYGQHSQVTVTRALTVSDCCVGG